jgi:Ni,Fe-hydrogenase III component G
MQTAERLQQARTLLEAWASELAEPSPDRLDAEMSPDRLTAGVQALHEHRWGYLSTITGLDLGPDDGRLEVLYHFCSGGAIVTLRVKLPHEDPKVPTISNIIPSAVIFEQEIEEMLGIDVLDIPIKERLFLPDDWPDGVYPLRKDAQLEGDNE